MAKKNRKNNNIAVIMFIVAGLVILGTQTNLLTVFTQTFLYPDTPLTQLSEGTGSVVLNAVWSNIDTRVQGGQQVGDDIVVLERLLTFRHGSPTFVVFHTPNLILNRRFNTEDVVLGTSSCIIDVNGANERTGSINILSKSASCIAKVDGPSSDFPFTFLECDVEFRFECIDTDGQVADISTNGKLLLPSSVDVIVEVLKDSSQCTQTQKSLCNENAECINNQCVETFPIIDIEILDNEVIIDGENVGTIINGDLINEEGEDIGDVKDEKVTIARTKDEGFNFELVGGIFFVVVLIAFLIWRFVRKR